MTEEEVRARISALADKAAEIHTLLTADLPQDEEGFLVPDGSDLSDACVTLNEIATGLSRLAFKIAREGVNRK